MKQRITKEQVLSLNEEQREKLRELWEPKLHETILYEFEEETIVGITLGKDILISEWDYQTEEPIEINKEDCLPLLSIGDMIEILEESSSDFTISKVFDSISERFEHWSLYVSYMGVDDIREIEVNSYDLCDCLFEAIKEVL